MDEIKIASILFLLIYLVIITLKPEGFKIPKLSSKPKRAKKNTSRHTKRRKHKNKNIKLIYSDKKQGYLDSVWNEIEGKNHRGQ